MNETIKEWVVYVKKCFELTDTYKSNQQDYENMERMIFIKAQENVVNTNDLVIDSKKVDS